MSTPSHAHPQGIQHSHSRSASATTGLAASTPAGTPGPPTLTTPATGSSSAGASNVPQVPHIRIVPHLDAPRSLHFEVVDKDVPEGFVLKIGRFTDRQSLPNRITFKSKVVSRGHAEIFTEHGKFYIRDTKSSSGTFLNHARLSPPGVESKPTPLKDGDVVQLGVDYQGGTQEIYRCVKMRLELNRSWQQQANPFRMNTLKVIRSLTTANAASSTDCCICLFRIASFQSLFVAPCSHVYHYKCIRPLLTANHPGFLCPLCRTFADLEDSVEIEDPIEEDIPAEEVAAAIENATRGQEETSVEQVREDSAPSAQVETPLAEVLAEEAYAPTPPSEQAHTFQPPQSNTDHHATYSNEEVLRSQHRRQEREDVVEGDAGAEDRVFGVRQDGPLPSAGYSEDTVPQSPSAEDTGAMPMDIHARPMTVNTATAVTSVNTSAQQSPSSAFFMAPSPPAFSTSHPVNGAVSISVESPRSRQQQPSEALVSASASLSNRMEVAGQMIQNFVRNVSTPTRNRTRTNSNSPLNPMVQQQLLQQHQQQSSQSTEASSSGLSGLGSQSPATQNGLVVGGGGDLHGDVFGKTLVMTTTPPPSALGVGDGTRSSRGLRNDLVAENDEGRPQELETVMENRPGSELAPSSALSRTSSHLLQDSHEINSVLSPNSLPGQQRDAEQEHPPRFPLQDTGDIETSV
ncbi:hypothetical protein EDD11_010057 [Mortierella claussenii]|nr:hypothetical protein EDD11_010057 [Mortierella claussenii]